MDQSQSPSMSRSREDCERRVTKRSYIACERCHKNKTVSEAVMLTTTHFPYGEVSAGKKRTCNSVWGTVSIGACLTNPSCSQKCNGETPCRNCLQSRKPVDCVYPIRDKKVPVAQRYIANLEWKINC